MTKRNTLSSFLFIIFVFLMRNFIFSTEHQISGIKNSSGDTIDYFDIIGSKEEKICAADLCKKDISAIFVFSNCYTCEKNKPFWKRLAYIHEKKMDVFGIILTDLPVMLEVSKSIDVPFKLYCPADINKFIKEFKIKKNSAQTILIKDKMIIYKKDGILEMSDYSELLGLIKG